MLASHRYWLENLRPGSEQRRNFGAADVIYLLMIRPTPLLENKQPGCSYHGYALPATTGSPSASASGVRLPGP